MTPERWKKIEELFHSALAVGVNERAEYLLRLCPDDEALRREVEALIIQHNEDPEFLDQPVANVTTGALSAETESTEKKIGPYRLIRTIGTGGMGEVFLAKKEDSDVEHLVALKVVRSAVVTADARARFVNERAILARLNHPNIARFLDAAVTEIGQPYLAMEYVQGVPITHHASTTDLDRCLQTFETVCEAVQYAHQNLVVHRDIKPGNILVTEQGGPK
ncbi:MAG: serine/threonine protein kinase, partial [Rhodothermales bacterium]|nr:serine/threonine protein kinase [Rhodothermales bacterium]